MCVPYIVNNPPCVGYAGALLLLDQFLPVENPQGPLLLVFWARQPLGDIVFIDPGFISIVSLRRRLRLPTPFHSQELASPLVQLLAPDRR